MRKVLFIFLSLLMAAPSFAKKYNNNIELGLMSGNDDYKNYVKLGYVVGIELKETSFLNIGVGLGRGNSLSLMIDKYKATSTGVYTDGIEEYFDDHYTLEFQVGLRGYFTDKDTAPFISLNIGTGLGCSTDECTYIDRFIFDVGLGVRFKLEDENAIYVSAGLYSKPYQVEYYDPAYDTSIYEYCRCPMLGLNVGFTF